MPAERSHHPAYTAPTGWPRIRLLEGLVFARRIAVDLQRKQPIRRRPAHDHREPGLIDRSVVPAMQQAMSRDAGRAADAAGLDRCARELAQVGERQSGAESGLESWEATNLMTVATAIVASARLREESRGAHWRDDFEGRREPWHGHLIVEHDVRGWPPTRFRCRPADPGRWTGKPLMIYTKLADIAEVVAAAGLDVDALSLIVTEALDEDLGGRGVLPPGAGTGLDVTSYATIPVGAAAHGEFVARQPGTVAGMPVAAYTVASVCVDGRRLRAHGARGRWRSRRARRCVDLGHGQYPRAARGRTGFAEFDHHDVRRRYGHSGLGRCACRNDDESSGLAEDDSRPADAAKVRRPDWRRCQSPDVIG